MNQAASESPFPLERRAEIGLGRAVLDTLLGVLTKPWEFFTHTSREASVLPPLALALAIQVPIGLAYAVVTAVSSAGTLATLRATPGFVVTPYMEAANGPIGAVVGQVLGVVLYPLMLLIVTAIEWVMLYAVGVRTLSFRELFRGLAYLHATSLVLLVLAPVALILAFVAPTLVSIVYLPYLLLWVVWLVIGISKLGKTEPWRVAVAQAGVATLCCCVPAVLGALSAFAAGGLAAYGAAHH